MIPQRSSILKQSPNFGKRSQILGTHLGDSWTHHLCLGQNLTKNAQVGLTTFYPTRTSDNPSKVFQYRREILILVLRYTATSPSI